MDCSPPGSTVHGILQARILEWVAKPSTRASFQPRNWTVISCAGGYIFCTHTHTHTHTYTYTHTHIHIWEKEMSNHPIFLSGESHWLRSLVGYSPKGHKELNTTQWLQKNTYIYIFIYDPGSYLGETNKSALCQILVFISALLLNYCWFTMFCQFAGVQYFDSHICIHRYISIYTYSVWDSFSF